MSRDTAASVLLVGQDADDLARTRAAVTGVGLRVVREYPGGQLPDDPGTGGTATDDTSPIVDLALVVRPTMTQVPELVQDLIVRQLARRVVVLSDDRHDDGAVLAALAAGADGWLPIDLECAALGRSLRAVLAGEPAISRRHVARLLDAIRQGHRRTVALAGGEIVELTDREFSIFLELAGGARTRAIAERLSVSEGTVRWHTARVLRKCGVSSRAELAQLVRHGGPAQDSPRAAPAQHADAPDRELPAQRRAAPEQHAQSTKAWTSLAPAELRVVRLAAQGRTNKQIADQLFLSKHTVASHLKSAFAKLGVRSRVELTHTVLRHEPARSGRGAPPARETGVARPPRRA